jgi:hypothetical protein
MSAKQLANSPGFAAALLITKKILHLNYKDQLDIDA